jgi:Uri superfamily endonuclease
MKGAYVLIIKIERPMEVKIRSLGDVTFESGVWVYVGSAMGDGSTNLENRLRRHFRSEKTIYWHIDHLLDSGANLVKAYWTESPTHAECDIAQELQSRDSFRVGPKRFGSSDCKKGCRAHILRFSLDTGVEEVIETTFERLGFKPSLTSDGIL